LRRRLAVYGAGLGQKILLGGLAVCFRTSIAVARWNASRSPNSPKILSTGCNCSAWRKMVTLADYAVMFGDTAVIATQTETDQEM
jgi:hypothetical protein